MTVELKELQSSFWLTKFVDDPTDTTSVVYMRTVDAENNKELILLRQLTVPEVLSVLRKYVKE